VEGTVRLQNSDHWDLRLGAICAAGIYTLRAEILSGFPAADPQQALISRQRSQRRIMPPFKW